MDFSGDEVLKKVLKVSLISIAGLVAIILFGRFVLKLGSWQYDSFEAFKKDAFLRFVVDIPEGATDQTFFYENIGVGKNSLYAFTLDDEAYEDFISDLEAEYDLKNVNGDENAQKYGYPKWYGMKVKDAHDDEYILDDFPIYLDFDKVTDGDVSEYEIIVYSPVGTGSVGYGVIADPATGRVVVFNKGNIK